jgi:hypothetical protein
MSFLTPLNNEMKELDSEFQNIEILNVIIRETGSYGKLVHQFKRELEYPLDKFLRDQMKENPEFQEKIYQYKYKIQFNKCLEELKLFLRHDVMGVMGVRILAKDIPNCGILWKIQDINSLRPIIVSSLAYIQSRLSVCFSQVRYSGLFVILSRHYLLHGHKFPQDLKDHFHAVRNILLETIERESKRTRHTDFTIQIQNHPRIILANMYLKKTERL